MIFGAGHTGSVLQGESHRPGGLLSSQCPAQRFLLPLPQGSHPSPPLLLLLLPSVIYLKGRVGERERQGERDFLSTGLLLQTSVSRSDKSQELRTPSESPSWLAWNQVLESCSAAFTNTLQGA